MAPKLFPLLLLFLPLFLQLLNQSVECRALKPTSVTSNFTQLLQTLEGSVKGQTVEGLSQVKRYLQHYGYYPNAGDNLIVDDEFEETLDAALKLYQKNYRLPVTGRVDAGTIKEMAVPRCGNPDIVHRSPPQVKSGDSKFHMVAHYAFFDGTPRWSKSQLTYSFGGMEVVPFDTLRQVCARAFSKWSQNSAFTFQEAAGGTKSDITIGFYSGDHNDRFPFDGHGRILAHAFPPELGQFHYDADENWSTQPAMNQVDLESVAVHEIGHLLGLGHSTDRNSIMFSEIGQGVVKRDLTQDDIDGIKALYSN